MRLRHVLAALLVFLVLATGIRAGSEGLVIHELERQRVLLSQDYFEQPRVNLAVFEGEELRLAG